MVEKMRLMFGVEKMGLEFEVQKMGIEFEVEMVELENVNGEKVVEKLGIENDEIVVVYVVGSSL